MLVTSEGFQITSMRWYSGMRWPSIWIIGGISSNGTEHFYIGTCQEDSSEEADAIHIAEWWAPFYPEYYVK